MFNQLGQSASQINYIDNCADKKTHIHTMLCMHTKEI